MRAVSRELGRALDGTHGRVIEVTCNLDSDGSKVCDVPISGGTVRADLTRSERWSGSIEVADWSLLPTGADSPLSGFAGTHLRIHVGAVTSAGPETIPLAYLWPGEIQADRARGSDTFTINLQSPAAWAATDDSGPYISLAGETVHGYCQRLLDAALPWTVTVLDQTDTAGTQPAPPVSNQGSPWAAAVDMATQAGAVLEPIFRGTFRLRDPYVFGAPTQSFSVGPGGTITSLQGEVGRGGGFANRVRVVLTGPEGEAVGDASITTGATRYGGPAGKVMRTWTQPGQLDEAAAQVLAAQLLASTSAATRTTGFTAMPDPRTELGDSVWVTYLDGSRLRHMVTFLEWPLGPGDMNVGVRTDAAV